MNKSDLKIIFLGTPEFAVESLDRLVKEGYNVKAVVTMPDKPAGRGHKMLQSDVKKYALQAGLPVLQPVNLKDPEFLDELRSYEADLFIVIAFRMLPQAVWQMPRLGTFNLHASLLPRYRGAAPINRAVMNGDKKTGVTTFFLKHEIDTGDIIDQEEIEIADNENVGSVHDRLMHLGAAMVEKTVRTMVAQDGFIASKPQPEGEFIPAPKIFAETCIIDWNKPREEVRNLIRGLSPYPAARSFVSNAEGAKFSLKIFAAETADPQELASASPGSICTDKKAIYVKCADGSLKITDIQLQGKKRMATDAFLLGFHLDTQANLYHLTASADKA
jgi:methionyl-tRNA formyltransferase